MSADHEPRQDGLPSPLASTSADAPKAAQEDAGQRQNSDGRDLHSSSFETDLSAPRRRHQLDRANEYKSDPKFQKYVQLVERNLQSFEYVGEWADVTAFLTKLGRSFEIYAQFAVVPHKETVAKRLAQCLNPALPTGVHQKALNIYNQIFRQIGREQLVADLALYAYGLFPFMRNASLKAKPQLLDIFREHFVPLGARLRPCMKSFTVGLLPGLEDGSMDVSARVMELLDALRDAVDEAFFFQTLFLAMATNVEQRESALKYLSQRLPVFMHADDVARVSAGDGALIVRALAATLTDARALVLRAALDLVMTRFPLRTCVFKQRDLVLLMKHAAAVVLKKDMSLNRRLYTWLLGPAEAEAEQAAHFAQHAQEPLTTALLGAFAATAGNPDHQHTVLRVLIGLLDKPGIAQPVLEAVFVPLLQLLIAERDARSDGALPVKLASVSRMFVEMLDPIFTWSSVISQLASAVAAMDNSGALELRAIVQALKLVLFVVQTFELDDDASLQVHMPMALLTVLAALDRVLRRPKAEGAASISCCFTRTAIELLTRIPKPVFASNSDERPPLSAETGGALDVDALFATARAFYQAQRPGDGAETENAAEIERSAAAIVRGPGLLSAVIRLSKGVAARLGALIAADGPADLARMGVVALEDTCHILRTAAAYACDLLGAAGLASCQLPLPEYSAAHGTIPEHADAWAAVFVVTVPLAGEFAAVDIALSTLLEFVERGLLPRTTPVGGCRLEAFVERLWQFLEPEHAAHHFRAAQLIVQLRNQTDASVVEQYLARKLACADSSDRCTAELARYAVFWRSLCLIQRESQWGSGHDPLAFARLLLLVLDGAAPHDVCQEISQHSASRAWVDRSADEWECIVVTLLTLLLVSIRTRWRLAGVTLATGHSSWRQVHEVGFDSARISYYLGTVHRYVELAGDGVVQRMASTMVPRSARALAVYDVLAAEGQSWLQALLSAAVDFALADSATAVDGVDATRARAAELAAFLVARPGVAWPLTYIAAIRKRVIDALLYCVLHQRTAVQPPLLDLLASLVNARVRSDEAPGTAAVDMAAKARLAGIGSGEDLRLVSRLVLAAFSMQLDIVALSKWAGFVRACQPHIQQSISAGAAGESGLLSWMALPCLHMLRLILSQCSYYFGRSNGLAHARHRRTPSQLWRRLVPLFVAPAASTEAAAPAMSVDVLVALLDAFDFFLALCLKNADRVPMAAHAAENRPGSRASNASAESSGTLGAVPILRFVSSIFGQDAAEDEPELPGRESGEAQPPSGPDGAAGSVEHIEALGFDLVPMLAVLQEVWEAFDFGRRHSLPSESRGQALPACAELNGLLLAEFGIAESHGDESAGAHVKKTVHGRITRILEHAVAAQPTEVTEAITALWVADNPQWITSLEASVRTGAGQGSRRRQSSSTSSLQMAQGHPPGSSDSAAVAAAAATAAPAEAIKWSWRATDLLERVSGQSPIAILTTLLNDLQIRSVDPAGAGAGYSSVSSGGGTATLVADARPHARMSLVEDIALIRFVELYARHRLTARSSAVLVPHIQSMLKEYNGGAQQFKFLLPFLLRMFTELCERLASNNVQAPDAAHRGYTRELSTQYAQMVDSCILIAGRSFDQSTWLRRAAADTANGGSGGALIVRTDALLRSADGAATHLLSEDDIIDHTLTYIGDMVIPLFAQLVPDYERQVTIASNIMHYAVTPAFRSHMTGGYSGPAQALASKSRHFARVLRCLDALGQQAPLMKVWRREVWEFFCDAKFFPAPTLSEHATMSPALAVHWRQLLRALLASEKDKFADLLAKVSSTSAAPAIFANREHEAHMRAIALRRLSFVIWAGTVNQYLSSLPHVQEKLVEILKSTPHPVVQMEVFLCLRVLLCRIANQHMSNFWPMLLTELMRLCLQQLGRSDGRGEEQANLFLAACKFLDLLFILGTEDFMIHQWIFITDTIDALYASRSASYALLDRLSTRLLSMPSTTRRTLPGGNGGGGGSSKRRPADGPRGGDEATYPQLLVAEDSDPTNLVYQPVLQQGLDAAREGGLESEELDALTANPLKRPIIRVRSVSSIRELDTFIHNASVQTYQAAFTLAEPDMEFIEALLVSDLMYLDLGGTAQAAESMSDQAVFP
ncbi:hypothetical protein LPJ61_003061 [Coemansia biformis]|uniref:Dopey N-terminal domain-containing protein n=1 Tax=Coemansia biformis TaxID=1286918 RepID=A0A9W8CYZ8_9FUNG|nr:hypothetical protein LPJ61_003061 [Coemansia biformis]